MTTTVATIAALALTPAASASTVAQAKKEIRRLFGKDAPRAYCIVGRESSWQPRAVSRTNDHGLFQLNAPTWARFFGSQWRFVYDPVQNARMAYVIYRRAGGFSPWDGGRWAC